MSFQRNWFIYLSLFLYMAASILILIFGISGFHAGKPYSYFAQAALLTGCFAVFIVINILFYLVTRPVILRLLKPLKRLPGLIEIMLILTILTMGLLLRISYIRSYPVGMESDYKFYYDVANMIKDHTLLEKSNNEYIALFPHTFGYSYVLSLVFRLFGSAPEVCLYFNAVLSVLTALFCCGIGRCLAGRVAGISALFITCFWPSQIIFSNINGSEAAFCFFLYGAALLITIVLKSCSATSRIGLVLLLHLLTGILLAIAAAIRPMSLAFLLALLLCFLFFNRKLTYRKSITELSVSTIFLSKGILRAVFIVLGYILCSQFITAGISVAIQKEVADSGATGYSLMVGLNPSSDGGHSQETMDFLFDTYKETGSANETNRICMDQARKEAQQDPLAILELMAKKFYLIWSNDDYATTTNIVTMNNQGLLTQERERALYRLADWNNVFYLFIVFLSIAGAGFLFARDNNAQVFAVFFVGAVVMHLLVEMQNRYHYYLLQNFAILAGAGLGLLFQRYLKQTQMMLLVKSGALDNYKPGGDFAESAAVSETGRRKGRDKALLYSEEYRPVDILDAIKEGHIIITASKAYQDGMPAAEAVPADNNKASENNTYIADMKDTTGYKDAAGRGEEAEEKEAEEKETEDKETEEKKAEERKAGVKTVGDKEAEEENTEDSESEDKITEYESAGVRKEKDKKAEEQKAIKKKITNYKITDHKITEQKITEQKITNQKITDQKITDRKVTNRQATDPKIINGKRKENKADGSKVTDKKAESRRTENRKTDNGRAEDRRTEDSKTEDRRTENRKTEGGKIGDGKTEHKKTEDKKIEDKKTEDRITINKSLKANKQDGGRIDRAEQAPARLILSEQELQRILETSIREFSRQVVRVLLENAVKKPAMNERDYRGRKARHNIKRKFPDNHATGRPSLPEIKRNTKERQE